MGALQPFHLVVLALCALIPVGVVVGVVFLVRYLVRRGR